MSAQERWVASALGFIAAVTVAWWALALWPLPAEAPAWLARTRDVCFNTGPTGLPDPSGWILLIGQPLGMVGTLWAGWGAELQSGLRSVARAPGGKMLLGTAAVLFGVGVAAAGARVASAAPSEVALADGGVPPSTYPRLDRALPDMSALVDHAGRSFRPDVLAGRGAFVTFAFAHCEAICPLLVRSTLAARDALREEGTRDMIVLAITLDPLRDTPSRLPEMAGQWGLGPDDMVLGGEVEAVEAVLDAWNIARSRDERTGEVIHPAIVYLVEPDGTVAYASTGGPEQLTALAERLER